MTTYLGEKPVGIGTIKATEAVGKVITDKATILGDGFTDPLKVNTLLFATSESVAASAEAIRTEVNNKFTVVDSAIKGANDAIEKTRADYIQADSEIHQILNNHTGELTTLRGNQASLGDQVSNIESKIPESASENNPLITKQQLLDEEMDIREDLNETSSELQTQITAQATEVNKLKEAIAGLGSLSYSVVNALPATGEKGVIYLVPKDGERPDVHDEYLWIDGQFELIGTTQFDLSNYVQKTDYANSKTAGLIKGYAANGFGFVPDSGYPYCESKSLASFNSSGGNLFISKGTIENIKYSYVRDGIAKNTYSLSDSEKEKVRNWIGAGVPTVFDVMPNIYASAGKTYQYVGETTDEFTSGYFYKSVSQGFSYIASDSNLTFDFDLFWSELASAGITLETLQMTEADKERGGFSIIGTVESETNYRVLDINGIQLDVLLTQSIQATSSYVGMTNRWYYKPSETFAWERVDVQPVQEIVESRLYNLESSIGNISTALTAILGE